MKKNGKTLMQELPTLPLLILLVERRTSLVIRRIKIIKKNLITLIHSITVSPKGDFRWQVLTTLPRRMHLGFSLSLPPYLIHHQKRFTVYFHYHSPAKVRLLDHRFCIFPLPLRSFHARAIYYFRLPLG